MNKLLTILCLILLSVHSYSQDVVTGHILVRDGIRYHQDTNEPVTGIVEEFYEDGQLLSRKNYIDGKEDGPYELFYENGQLNTRGNYIDGKEDGLFEEFYRNGQLFSRKNLKDGKEDGLRELFYENGKLWERGNYKDGKQDGLYENFHDDGRLLYKGNYKNDKRDEFWIDNSNVGTTTQIGDVHGWTSGTGFYKDGVRVDEEGELVDLFLRTNENP